MTPGPPFKRRSKVRDDDDDEEEVDKKQVDDDGGVHQNVQYAIKKEAQFRSQRGSRS